MIYRVATMTCANCRHDQRLRIAQAEEIERYPSCHNCGRTEWTNRQRPELPEVASAPIIEPAPLQEYNLDLVNTATPPPWMPDEPTLIVTGGDVVAFNALIEQEGREYIWSRFRQFMAERDAALEDELADAQDDRARMWRQVHEVLPEGLTRTVLRE